MINDGKIVFFSISTVAGIRNLNLLQFIFFTIQSANQNEERKKNYDKFHTKHFNRAYANFHKISHPVGSINNKRLRNKIKTLTDHFTSHQFDWINLLRKQKLPEQQQNCMRGLRFLSKRSEKPLMGKQTAIEIVAYSIYTV